MLAELAGQACAPAPSAWPAPRSARPCSQPSPGMLSAPRCTTVLELWPASSFCCLRGCARRSGQVCATHHGYSHHADVCHAAQGAPSAPLCHGATLVRCTAGWLNSIPSHTGGHHAVLEPMQPSCLVLPRFSDPALQVASLLWGTPRARQIRAQIPTAVQAGPWLCKQPRAGSRAAAFPNPPLALASQSWSLLLASSATDEARSRCARQSLRAPQTETSARMARTADAATGRPQPLSKDWQAHPQSR